MSDVRLIQADGAYAEILARLHAATIGAGDAREGWSAEFVTRLLALPGTFAFVALAPDPAGFVLCLPAGEAVDIAAIGVVAAARRRGVGRGLVESCIAEAGRAGAQRLMLEVAADNAPALGFYRALGFEETGRRAGYYLAEPRSHPRDALILSKAIGLAKFVKSRGKIN